MIAGKSSQNENVIKNKKNSASKAQRLQEQRVKNTKLKKKNSPRNFTEFHRIKDSKKVLSNFPVPQHFYHSFIQSSIKLIRKPFFCPMSWGEEPFAPTSRLNKYNEEFTPQQSIVVLLIPDLTGTNLVNQYRPF